MGDVMSPQERAEALFRIEPHGDSVRMYDLGRTDEWRWWFRNAAEAYALRAMLAAPIAAAIEAAARDATEAAAAVCDALVERASALAVSHGERRDFEAHVEAETAAGVARWLAAQIRAGGTGGEHGQR